MTELETEVELLKKELHNQKKIHDRLDVAIEKLTDVSNSIHRMLAVHEEKLTKQEEAIIDAEQKIEVRRAELSKQIDDLHSRITTNTKELMILEASQHEKHSKEIKRLSDNINNRVGVLEKWRWLIIGGAIIAGFILNKFISFSP